MKTQIKTSLTIGIFLVVCFFTASANAVGAWAWATESAISRFDERDFELLREAGREALNNQADKVEVDWKNPDSGNSGSVTALNTRQIGDKTCRDALLKNNAKSIQGTALYLLCKQENGEWEFSQSVE